MTLLKGALKMIVYQDRNENLSKAIGVIVGYLDRYGDYCSKKDNSCVIELRAPHGYVHDDYSVECADYIASLAEKAWKSFNKRNLENEI